MDRYDRLLHLSSFSKEKLFILQKKKVLIVGVGGVGQHVATYLTTNGVTNLSIIDYDIVEISNLNRQILLTENDVGLPKVEVVKNALLNRNSEASITAINVKFTERNATDLINGYDIVVDAVDSWETKLIIAEACQKSRTSLLHIGVDGEKGQCCLFVDKPLSEIANKEILSAPKDGVMGPMVGLVSSMASILLIDYLTGNSENNDKLFYYDYKSSHIGKVLI